MYPINSSGVASNFFVVVTHNNAVIKLECAMGAAAADTLWLQIHDSNVLPANGAVPLKTWPAGQTQYKEFKNGELRVGKGVVVALSTTPATLTIATVGTDVFLELDMEVEHMDYFVGSTITAASGIASFFSPLANKMLLFQAQNLEAGVRYLMMFNSAALPANGTIPLRQWNIGATGGGTDTINVSFGDGLRSVGGYTPTQNLYFALSSTAQTLTIATGAGMAVSNDQINS